MEAGGISRQKAEIQEQESVNMVHGRPVKHQRLQGEAGHPEVNYKWHAEPYSCITSLRVFMEPILPLFGTHPSPSCSSLEVLPVLRGVQSTHSYYLLSF